MLKKAAEWEAEEAKKRKIASALVEMCRREGGITAEDVKEICALALRMVVIR